jgi:hypothetical protein
MLSFLLEIASTVQLSPLTKLFFIFKRQLPLFLKGILKKETRKSTIEMYYNIYSQVIKILGLIIVTLDLPIPIVTPSWITKWEEKSTTILENLKTNPTEETIIISKVIFEIVNKGCPGWIIKEDLCGINPIYEILVQISTLFFKNYGNSELYSMENQDNIHQILELQKTN